MTKQNNMRTKIAKEPEKIRKVDRREIAYRQGMKLFHAGKPCPANTWTDEEWHDALNEGQCRWLGWMMARGFSIWKDIRHKEAVRDYIEHGIDLSPDFE